MNREAWVLYGLGFVLAWVAASVIERNKPTRLIFAAAWPLMTILVLGLAIRDWFSE